MKYICNVCVEKKHANRNESCILITDCTEHPILCPHYFHTRSEWKKDKSPDYSGIVQALNLIRKGRQMLENETGDFSLNLSMPEEAQKVVNEHFDELIGEEK